MPLGRVQSSGSLSLRDLIEAKLDGIPEILPESPPSDRELKLMGVLQDLIGFLRFIQAGLPDWREGDPANPDLYLVRLARVPDESPDKRQIWLAYWNGENWFQGKISGVPGESVTADLTRLPRSLQVTGFLPIPSPECGLQGSAVAAQISNRAGGLG